MINNSVIEMKKINKSFSGVKVLLDVDFDLKKGEILGLVGRNGAGKTTLMQILMGIHKYDSGEIKINERLVDKNETVKEREKDISMVFQNFSLIPDLSVIDNIFLNNEYTRFGLINRKKTVDLLMNFLKQIDIDIDIHKNINLLDTCDVQIVELVKALIREKNVLILDEPTRALSEEQIERFFEVLKKLKERGVSIIFISHAIDLILKYSERITVLRDGKIIITDRRQNFTKKKLVNTMTGDTSGDIVKQEDDFKQIKRDNPLLKIENLSYKNNIKDISFSLFPGEILGLAGLMGSGSKEIIDCIYGVNKEIVGNIFVDGKMLTKKEPANSLSQGLSLVPDERQTKGLIIEQTVKDNVVLSILNKIKRYFILDNSKANKIVDTYIDKIDIKVNNKFTKVKFLSGGNQQKVVLAKVFATNPRVLLLNDPTFGIDVSAKEDIYDIVKNYTSAGNAAIFTSSELEEIISLCDRVLIIKKGKIFNELSGDTIREMGVKGLLHEIQ